MRQHKYVKDGGDLLTFRFRHDLQFIDSRGSLEKCREGSLSMPIWGLGRARGWAPGRCGAFIERSVETGARQMPH